MEHDRFDLIGGSEPEPEKITYDPSYAGRVRDMCYLGASPQEIAMLFGVSTSTLKRWRDENPEFDQAWEIGGASADAKVAAAFYKRAVGYSYVSSRRIDEDGTVHENVTEVKPDVNACTKWLAVRQPEKWGKLIGSDSGVNTPPPSLGATLLSDTELARRLAFLLAKAVESDNTITIDSRSIENDSNRPILPEAK